MNEIRKRILEEAIGMVHRDDLDRITMRRLAERVGLSAASIYQHFDGKRGLESEIALYGFEQLEQTIGPAVILEDPREALAELTRRYFRFGLSHPKLYRLMFQSLTEPRMLRPSGHPLLEGLYAAIRAIFERGIASGSFRSLDPDVALRVRWAMVHGLVQLVITRRLAGSDGGSELTPLRDALVDTLLRSLRP